MATKSYKQRFLTAVRRNRDARDQLERVSTELDALRESSISPLTEGTVAGVTGGLAGAQSGAMDALGFGQFAALPLFIEAVGMAGIAAMTESCIARAASHDLGVVATYEGARALTKMGYGWLFVTTEPTDNQDNTPNTPNK